MELRIREVADSYIDLEWDAVLGADCYEVLWKDRKRESMAYKSAGKGKETTFRLKKASSIPYYLKVCAYAPGEAGEKLAESGMIQTPVKAVFHEQLETLNRGLVAVCTKTGIFLSWRLFKDEVTGYSATGLTGTDFVVMKNGKKLATVMESTNYLDADGTKEDRYAVIPFISGREPEETRILALWEKETPVSAWSSGSNYIDIPLRIPEGGVTPAGETFVYHANDISVGDVDGDGEYEYIVKWDPSNSHDVSIKGYTGKCYLDCYKLSGRLLWRLDMGVNIRAGAHYTQFMVYDFNGDGKAEMAVKTAPGTCMYVYDENGNVSHSSYITLPKSDVQAHVTHADNYVCSSADYAAHLEKLFAAWQEHPMVKDGTWPKTLEECFGIEPRYSYPLSAADAKELVHYFIYEYAPARSPKNHLEAFEGFIYEGPEYLTMFDGMGKEIETIPFKYGREDDGLMWGDYSMNRIEPCNRVDRFLSGVAYLDGERPYLIICRGYYTRTTIVAYDFFKNKFHEVWSIDSGHVRMANPFRENAHAGKGSDPVYGILAGQGNHSLSTADVDGDGCQEIIYGAACIDQDGSILYSSYGYLPDGRYAKFGHGDAMHVANINPDVPGLEIFNVFEGATEAPYGFALRDAENGEVYFGEYAECDLGRCMIGDIDPDVRGLQVWVNDVYSVKGEKLPYPALSTNQCIHWAADLTTQVVDEKDYLKGEHIGVINDRTHGVMLRPEDTATNNGTKGNPCLIADLFGDFREEIVLRKKDDSALRIYINTDLTEHKLFTPLHDVQYRTGVAWQNNCYNQPGYVSYYYASDMDFSEVLPQLVCSKTEGTAD